uniref:Palmitoyltransferase n=1 Tax=Rhabditophanes sp. KR3021 TaxID=114890 RepID=A0AC35TJX1_9BILA
MPYASNGQYVPWYLARRCPIFCLPLLPLYQAVWPARTCVLITGALLFILGVTMMLGLIVTCVAIECGAYAGVFLPIAFILVFLGILMVHIGWAAHLLDFGGKLPLDETFTEEIRTLTQNDPKEQDKAVFDSVREKHVPALKQGHWQFDERESWQAVANPYPIQNSLKGIIPRDEY